MFLGESRGGTREAPGFATAEPFDRRADEQFEADQAADRIARQAKDERLLAAGMPFDAKPERFTRLEIDLVKDLLNAEIGQDSRHQIENAGGDSAREDQHVVREADGYVLAEARGQRVMIESVDGSGRTFVSTVKWASLVVIQDQLF